MLFAFDLPIRNFPSTNYLRQSFDQLRINRWVPNNHADSVQIDPKLKKIWLEYHLLTIDNQEIESHPIKKKNTVQFSRIKDICRTTKGQ